MIDIKTMITIQNIVILVLIYMCYWDIKKLLKAPDEIRDVMDNKGKKEFCPHCGSDKIEFKDILGSFFCTKCCEWTWGK